MTRMVLTHFKHMARNGLFLLSCLSLFSPSLQADTLDERLVTVGLKLFPAVIAATQVLAPEADSTPLTIVVVHKGDAVYAEQVAERIKQNGSMRGRALDVITAPVSGLDRVEHAPFALFVAQRLGHDITPVIDYTLRNDVLGFSPFRGDVEEGILAGVSVTDRILPYINTRTLSLMPFALKPFFLKVAEKYAP